MRELTTNDKNVASTDNSPSKSFHADQEKASLVSEVLFNYDLSNSYRWIVVVIYIVICFFAGPIFLNFMSLKKVYSVQGFYDHLCNSGSNGYEILDNGKLSCDDKNIALDALLSPAVATMYAFDLVAGIMLDSFGAKITSVFGVVLQFIGWILLGLSSSFPGFHGYKTGTILLAAGQEPAFFGLISVANLFPGWEATVVGVLAASRSLSLMIPVLLELIACATCGIGLKSISFFFAGVLALSTVLTFIFVPFQQFPKVSVGFNHGTKDSVTSTEDMNEKGMPTPPNTTRTSYKEYLRRKPKMDMKLCISEAKSQIKGLKEHVLTIPYALLFLLPISAFIRNNYYTVSTEVHVHGKAQMLYKIITGLSFLPCPFLGLVADRLSTALTIAILAAVGGVSMLLVMFNVAALEYLSVILNCIFISFLSSQFYTYVQFNYPQAYMGALVGLPLLCGGLIGLLATQMNEYSLSKGFLAMDTFVTVQAIVAVITAVYLHYKVERPIRQAKKAKKEESFVRRKDLNISAYE